MSTDAPATNVTSANDSLNDSLSAIDRRLFTRSRPRASGAARAVRAVALAAVCLQLVPIADAVAKTPVATTPPQPNDPSQTGTSAISQNQLVELQARVAKTPNDGPSWRALASAYVRRAYETADPSYYPLATTTLDRASKMLHNDPSVRLVRANLRLALHDFAGARTEAMAVLAVQPNSYDAKVALTDATIELGDYQTAGAVIDDLLNQRAGVASLSRLSYLRQLTGDIVGAETAMRAAVSAAPDGTIDRAFTLAYLGEVLLERGRIDPAATAFRRALAIYPESAVASLGLARISASTGHSADATAILNRLIDRVPLPGALGLRADIARGSKDRKGERSANQLLDASMDLFRANGAIVDAELAVLLADRGPSSASLALAAADRAYAARRTIFTADAKAWALYQAGRTKDAVPFIRSALATDPAVASIRWHAALIFDATGDRVSAIRELRRALVNPTFSPSQQPAMKTLADRLQVAL